VATARKSRKPATYNATLAAVVALDLNDRKRLLNALRDLLMPHSFTLLGDAVNLREKRFHKGLNCPHCTSEQVRRHGMMRDRQRYLCRACGKTFNDTTGTPLAGTHLLSKWNDYLECLLDGLSLRKTCQLLEISLTTAFYWRHKVLNALRRLEREGFKGVLEVDETYLLESRKGDRHITDRAPRKRGGKAPKRGISKDLDCILVARDRNGLTLAQIAARGRISLSQAASALNGILDDVTVLCSDAANTWRLFAQIEDIDHVELNASKRERVKNIYHIQNANGFHGRLKQWIKRFNGVSSKFLNNYLVLFRFLDARSKEAPRSRREGLLSTAFMTPAPETYHTIKSTCFVYPA